MSGIHLSLYLPRSGPIVAIYRRLRVLCSGPHLEQTAVPTIEQCRTYAAEYKALGKDPGNSARKCSVLMNIAHSWTALAYQLHSLADVTKEEK
jgi:hypothetical protein